MKQKDQIGHILDWLSESRSGSYKKVLEYCINRGIVSGEEELKKILNHMEKKGLLLIADNIFHTKITPEEAKGISTANYAQTFVNGGSPEKMIYTPPGTDIS